MKKFKWKGIKKNIITAYDKDAERRAKAKKQHWKKDEREVFLLYLKLEKKKNLLEIGAGVGQDSLYFKKHGLTVTSTDISLANAIQCKKQGLRAFILDVYDLCKLRKKYDAVYALNSLLHVPKNDFELILKRIKRSLKPQGLFYLGLYGGNNFEGILKNDHCKPKRFFSFYRTDDILTIVQRYYKLEYFKHITPFKDGGTFQSMILRKK